MYDDPSTSALLTDQYELVMAHGYWEIGHAEQEAVFYLGYRNNPFNSDYTVFCGLSDVIHYLSHFRFSESDIAYLRTLTRQDGFPQFSDDFLTYLAELKFSCTVDAAPEGTVMFAKEPLLRIQGPLLQCQLLETALINLTNFATLTATKASLICEAANQDPVVEFGLRRSQGPNGGLTASRAAYIGGCSSTSNVLAGKRFGIPIKGTLAHSWVMSFQDELASFRAFAQIHQENTTLLVDTYDTHNGVNNALIVGRELREQGLDLFAIRLDSGDLATLSREARQMLDEAGFTETKIMASGDLDEHIITKLKQNGAKIDVWGVGTKLSTCYDQPALNMVFKLCAIKPMEATKHKWAYKLKISDQPQKTTMAGIPQIRRYYAGQSFFEDVIFDVEMGIDDSLPNGSDQSEDVLVRIFDQGKLVYQQPTIDELKTRARHQVQAFRSAQKPMTVSMEETLQELQQHLLGS